MKIARSFKLALGFGLGLLSVYALAGVIQAASLFTGSRALANGNFWGSVSLVALVLSFWCFWLAREQFSNKSRPLPVWLALLLGLVKIVVALWLVSPVAHDLLTIDSCLDLGGSFDHVGSVCDLENVHPDMTTFDRQGFRLIAFALLLSSGIRSIRLGLRTRSSRSPLPTPPAPISTTSADAAQKSHH